MIFVINRKTKEVLLAKEANNGESWGVYDDKFDAVFCKDATIDSVCTRKNGKLYLNFEYNH